MECYERACRLVGLGVKTGANQDIRAKGTKRRVLRRDELPAQLYKKLVVQLCGRPDQLQDIANSLAKLVGHYGAAVVQRNSSGRSRQTQTLMRREARTDKRHLL